jgi:hypothetical protein
VGREKAVDFALALICSPWRARQTGFFVKSLKNQV